MRRAARVAGLVAVAMVMHAAMVTMVRGQDCIFCASGDIYVDSTGGYRNILLYIDDAVDYDPTILTNLQAYLNDASEALFEATEEVSGRYIADVTILVPSHWPASASYKYATTENPSKAAFVVANDEMTWGSNPHTVRQDNTCGSQGDYVVLPLTYVTSNSQAAMFGPVGKTIVHEWAHFRYGVFDESADEDGGETGSCDSSGVDQPPKCEASITGKYVSASDQPGQCYFLPNPEGQTATASLMYAPYLDSVYTFCNQETHNNNSHSMQNTLCNMKSVWEVMMEHPDYSTNIPAATSVPEIRFTLVQDNIQQIVIICDVSGSMAGDRLYALQKNVEFFIWSLYNRTAQTGIQVMVGMVEFESVARPLHPLVILNAQSAQTLNDSIPKVASGGTSIGVGILLALETIQTQGHCGRRGSLYVFTDGDENTAPMINDVRMDVCECNATVYGMLVQQVAGTHPLVTLATDTCGTSCVYDDTEYTTMYECLWSAASQLNPDLAPTQIAGNVATIPPLTTADSTVVIEQSLSSSVVFRFTWPASQALTYHVTRSTLREVDQYVFDSRAAALANRCDQLIATVTSPDGTVYERGSIGYKSDHLSIEIQASSLQAGTWHYSLNNPSAYDCDVRTTIESYPDSNVDSISMTYHVPKIRVALNPSNTPESNSIPLYVTLEKAGVPVGGAQVFAQVTSGSSLWMLQLLDNGAGADFRWNDGIYSRYFTEFNADGVYSIHFKAEGVAGQVRLVQDERSYGSGAPPLPDYRVHLTTVSTPAEAFQRSAAGGYVEISGYASMSPDMYPPSKIIDLDAFPAPIHLHDAKVNLTWTATGAILDRGIASFYDMRISDDPSVLSQDFDAADQVTSSMVLQGDLNAPKEAGIREHFVLDLVDSGYDVINEPYFIAVLAVNADGVASSTSNIATFTFAPPPACPPEEGGCK